MAFRAPEYERFTGTLSERPAWVPIWKATFKRGWASKWVKWTTLGAIGLGVAITLVLYFVQKVVPEWRTLMEDMGEQVGDLDPIHFDASVYLIILHWFIYPFLLPIAVLLGYDLIAGDLRSNALEAYFSRPITPVGYLFGRTAAFTSFLLLATLAPLLWIWTFDVSTAPEFTTYEHTLRPTNHTPEAAVSNLREWGWNASVESDGSTVRVHREQRGSPRRLERHMESIGIAAEGLQTEAFSTKHFERVKTVPLGMTAALLLVALTMALFIQALTTLTRNGTWTALVVLILFFLSGTVGPVLQEITRVDAFLAVAFWENIWVITNTFLGTPMRMDGHAPFGLCLGIMLSLLGLSLFVLTWRVRRKGVVG